MTTRCVFCSIIDGETPADVLARTEHVVAFLDHVPLFPGHVLVVPRRHVPTLTDLADSEVAPLFTAVREIARAVSVALDAPGTFVANNNVVSQSVPHLHVHVVPRRRGDGLRGFFWPRQRYVDTSHRQAVAASITRHLSL